MTKPKRKKKAARKLAPVYHSAPPVVLTAEQMAVVDPLVKLDKPVQTLGGLAGSGKTTVVSFLAKKLKNFACCAYTGKAADVLRSKGIDASTIHSLIYDLDDEDEEIKNAAPTFSKKPSIDCQGIIVDEASMVGREIYNDLVSYKLPIIFVGDHGQLEPVAEDIHLMTNPDYRLETIHRNAGDIALFAHHLRAGHPASTFKESPLVEIIHKRDCGKHLLEVDQIICAKNVTRVAINQYVRQLKGITKTTPIAGDKVISLKNSRRLRIYNGTQAIINAIGDRRLTLQVGNRLVPVQYDIHTFNQEKYVYEKSECHPLDYAYAITCHKAQGSEWAKVMVLEQICGPWDHKRWAYTAASRAKEKLIWVIE